MSSAPLGPRAEERSAWHAGVARPRIIAHRGLGSEAVENTLAAFRAARAAGADGIELDVMRCQSGEVVVFHDEDLRRLAGRPERVADLPLAALREVELGGGQTIPTLGEALEEIGPRLLINVELKTERIRDGGLTEAVWQVLRRMDLGGRLLVSSFNPLALARLRWLAPGVQAGLLFGCDQGLPLRRAWTAPLLRPMALHPEAALVDAISLRRWRGKGYAVHVWTVDDRHEMAALAALGVDAIITNRLDRGRAVVQAGQEEPGGQRDRGH